MHSTTNPTQVNKSHVIELCPLLFSKSVLHSQVQKRCSMSCCIILAIVKKPCGPPAGMSGCCQKRTVNYSMAVLRQSVGTGNLFKNGNTISKLGLDLSSLLSMYISRALHFWNWKRSGKRSEGHTGILMYHKTDFYDSTWDFGAKRKCQQKIPEQSQQRLFFQQTNVENTAVGHRPRRASVSRKDTPTVASIEGVACGSMLPRPASGR